MTTDRVPCPASRPVLSATRLMASVVFAVKMTSYSCRWRADGVGDDGPGLLNDGLLHVGGLAPRLADRGPYRLERGRAGAVIQVDEGPGALSRGNAHAASDQSLAELVKQRPAAVLIEFVGAQDVGSRPGHGGRALERAIAEAAAAATAPWQMR